MDAYTQADRLARIDTPLGEDKLLLLGMSGSEGVSQLFHYALDLASEDGKISFQDILGKPATVTLNLQDGKVRYFNGIISKFSHGETDERFTYYRAELVPWLWFLTRAADCRVFQEKKIPEVIEEIFRDAGFQDFELKLSASYDKWEYCVESVG
jgi:type VI secretion system secreted protein VgrG